MSKYNVDNKKHTCGTTYTQRNFAVAPKTIQCKSEGCRKNDSVYSYLICNVFDCNFYRL